MIPRKIPVLVRQSLCEGRFSGACERIASVDARSVIGGENVDAAGRRAAIIQILRDESPVTGSALSSRLGVTRQVIVQDMAVLRAQGEHILATPRGYARLPLRPAPGVTKLLAVKHDREHTRDELYTMVDMGAEVLDVTVEHPVYGQMTGMLALSSRSDVDQFIDTMDATKAGLLSSLTKGVHLHSIRCKTDAQLSALEQALAKKGYLLTE